MTPGAETLELDARGREDVVLDVALPVMAAQARSVRVAAFRSSMGVSGLSPREVARLRTLGLACGARVIGLFEGANDFALSFPPASPSSESFVGIDADLTGHALAPVVSDLLLASFGLPAGKVVAHALRGLTHVRGAVGQDHGTHVLRALGRHLGLDLDVSIEELGFEPQGLGRVTIRASRRRGVTGPVDWKDRGSLRGVRILIGGVRPRLEQLDRLEAALKEAWWERSRVEPRFERLITAGTDAGAFLQQDIEFERGGATMVEVVSRSAAPTTMARRVLRKAQAFEDSGATCDEVTGIAALSAAVGAGAAFELALPPSRRVLAVCALLRALGADLHEAEAPGLLLLGTKGRQLPS